MKTDVCKHQNRPSECLLCMEAIPTFLRRQPKDYDCAISMLAAQTVAKSKLLGENLVLKATIAGLRERLDDMRVYVSSALACMDEKGKLCRLCRDRLEIFAEGDAQLKGENSNG